MEVWNESDSALAVVLVVYKAFHIAISMNERIRKSWMTKQFRFINYRNEPPAPVRCDFSNERLQYCVDIAVLLERCDRSGYMAAYLSRMRREAIPQEKQGQVAADIRKFRRMLREGGYSVE